MKLNINPDWLRKMAEKEDNGIVSVGGLVTRMEAEAAAQTSPGTTLAEWIKIFPSHVNFLREGGMNAFVTGSRAYGTPTEESDVDLVVRGSDEDLGRLLGQSSDGDGSDGGTGSVSLRFEKLNLLFCLNDDAYNDWKVGTDLLKAEVARGGPRSRDRAIAVFDDLRDKTQKRLAAKR